MSFTEREKVREDLRVVLDFPHNQKAFRFFFRYLQPFILETRGSRVPAMDIKTKEEYYLFLTKLRIVCKI